MRTTRGEGGQHVVQGATHRSSLSRVERIHGAHQNFERIACQRFFALARQSQTYELERAAGAQRLGRLSTVTGAVSPTASQDMMTMAGMTGLEPAPCNLLPSDNMPALYGHTRTLS